MTSTARAKGREAAYLRRRQQVTTAINAATTNGGEISVSAIARAARVDRTFLYRHRDLLEQVHAAISAPPDQAAAASLVSRSSLQTDLVNAHERNHRLAARVRQLETRLSEALGEQAWRESGLGAPEDIDGLKRRTVKLEQELIDVRDRHDLAEQQLAAARAANRELMTQLNAPAGRALPDPGASRP
jgi:chromosome segregation ATPase